MNTLSTNGEQLIRRTELRKVSKMLRGKTTTSSAHLKSHLLFRRKCI